VGIRVVSIQDSLVDVVPCEGTGIFFLPQLDRPILTECYSKMDILKNTKLQVIALMEQGDDHEFWYDFQFRCSYHYGCKCVPVNDTTSAASFIYRLMQQDSKPSKSNHLTTMMLAPSKCEGGDTLDRQKTLQNFPGIGETKAQLLLQSFKSISLVASAPVSQLAAHLGPSAARKLETFLTSPM
jgi:ERCC4-type nuclease